MLPDCLHSTLGMHCMQLSHRMRHAAASTEALWLHQPCRPSVNGCCPALLLALPLRLRTTWVRWRCCPSLQTMWWPELTASWAAHGTDHVQQGSAMHTLMQMAIEY